MKIPKIPFPSLVPGERDIAGDVKVNEFILLNGFLMNYQTLNQFREGFKKNNGLIH